MINSKTKTNDLKKNLILRPTTEKNLIENIQKNVGFSLLRI